MPLSRRLVHKRTALIVCTVTRNPERVIYTLTLRPIHFLIGNMFAASHFRFLSLDNDASPPLACKLCLNSYSAPIQPASACPGHSVNSKKKEYGSRCFVVVTPSLSRHSGFAIDPSLVCAILAAQLVPLCFFHKHPCVSLDEPRKPRARLVLAVAGSSRHPPALLVGAV